MNINGWIKRFCSRVLNKIEDHLATIIAGFIILIITVLGIIFWEWLKTKHSLETYNWMWLVASFIFLFLLGYFLRSILRDRGRFKNQKDIKSQINDWFNKTYLYDCFFQTNTTISFCCLEDALNIKKGSSKIYLPILARQKNYGFELGKETFRIVQLTKENDIWLIFEQYLEENFSSEKNELLVSCNDIEQRCGWPGDAIKWFLLEKHPQNIERFRVEDKGADKVLLIIQKK